MGKLLTQKVSIAIRKFLVALKEWGKAASYAIQH